jgi:hypothetical protein
MMMGKFVKLLQANLPVKIVVLNKGTLGSDRSAKYERELLKRLWLLLQSTTGASDNQIVMDAQELPPGQAMEMGQIMPDVEEQ